MTPHPPDAGKMACRHVPRDPIAAFVHVCAHCGAPIEPEFCVCCDGMGLAGTSDARCPACKGTGVASWRATP